MNGNGYAFNALAGYKYNFENGFFVQPTLGLSYTEASLGSSTPCAEPGGDFQLTRGRVQSDLGRVGVGVGTTWVAGAFALQLLFNASVWHEFAGDILGRYAI
jgi:outer membrane autotransporter protein